MRNCETSFEIIFVDDIHISRNVKNVKRNHRWKESSMNWSSLSPVLPRNWNHSSNHISRKSSSRARTNISAKYAIKKWMQFAEYAYMTYHQFSISSSCDMSMIPLPVPARNFSMMFPFLKFSI
jgi:hypothetical protein